VSSMSPVHIHTHPAVLSIQVAPPFFRHGDTPLRITTVTAVTIVMHILLAPCCSASAQLQPHTVCTSPGKGTAHPPCLAEHQVSQLLILRSPPLIIIAPPTTAALLSHVLHQRQRLADLGVCMVRTKQKSRRDQQSKDFNLSGYS
jgi:hypothetical protein